MESRTGRWTVHCVSCQNELYHLNSTWPPMAGRSARHGIPITSYQKGSGRVIKWFHVCLEKLTARTHIHTRLCLIANSTYLDSFYEYVGCYILPRSC
jgi:hypothetical protein